MSPVKGTGLLCQAGRLIFRRFGRRALETPNPRQNLPRKKPPTPHRPIIQVGAKTGLLLAMAVVTIPEVTGTEIIEETTETGETEMVMATPMTGTAPVTAEIKATAETTEVAAAIMTEAPAAVKIKVTAAAAVVMMADVTTMTITGQVEAAVTAAEATTMTTTTVEEEAAVEAEVVINRRPHEYNEQFF